MKSLFSLQTLILSTLTLSVSFLHANSPESDHLIFEGSDGPGKGKHVVFLSGDEEYRSEEALPMLAQMLAKQGFKCTVLFSLNEDGTVNPDAGDNISHPEAMDTADALVMSLRFRHWDDKAMEHFDKAVKRGVALIALRTSTHAFNFPKESKWQKYSWRAPEELGWKNGFGRQVLGETWVSHHGKHKVEGCRSHIVEENKDHPILNGATDVFATSDVYGTRNLDQQAATVLLRGAVTETLEPDSKPIQGPKNDPMQALAWIREYSAPDGTTKGQAFCTTAGASDDFRSEGLRRLVINAALHLTGLQVPENADVTPIDPFEPTFYGFIREEGYFKNLNLRPSDFVVGKTRQTGLPGQKK